MYDNIPEAALEYMLKFPEMFAYNDEDEYEEDFYEEVDEDEEYEEDEE